MDIDLFFSRNYGAMLPETSTQLCVFCGEGFAESVSVSLVIYIINYHMGVLNSFPFHSQKYLSTFLCGDTAHAPRVHS